MLTQIIDSKIKNRFNLHIYRYSTYQFCSGSKPYTKAIIYNEVDKIDNKAPSKETEYTLRPI